MTVFEFYKKFDTEQKCVDYLSEVRWGSEIKCPHCGHLKYHIINYSSRQNGKDIKKETSKTEYKCANSKCRLAFSVKTGTIFHGSKVPLWQFFFLIYSMAINNKNISSNQQEISLGISQKTCWYIMSRIRMLCYQDENLKLKNEVEVDETYLASGKWRKWSGYVAGRQSTVLGLLERGGGKIIIKVIPNRSKKVVQDIILKHVECGSKLFTDGAACYFNMGSYYIHESVNHRDGEYVRGNAHTNNIEGAWSNFKKYIVGVHHGVSMLHLQRYCDEFAYRWNNKKVKPLDKFNDLLKIGCNTKPIVQKKVGLGVKDSIIENKKYRNKLINTDTGEVLSFKEVSEITGYCETHISKMVNNHRNNTTKFIKYSPSGIK